MAEKGLNCGINKSTIMATNITVPDIGDFENVEIIEILVKPGVVIKKNDPVVTLESDKSSVEVPSPFAGKISSLEVKIGDKVSKGSVLAIIETKEIDFIKRVYSVYKSITLLKNNMDYKNKSLIGFAGAPWTLLLYIIHKRSPKKDFDKSVWIILGAIITWILFYKIFGQEEFKSFFYNTKEIYQSMDWIHGIIHPEPFSSDQHSARATKILLILILSGLLIININFFKYKNILNEYKILLIFIFIISIITYKTALGRSDGPHIRSVTGLPLLLLCIITLNLIFDFILKNEKYLKIFQNITNFRNTISLMLISL